MSPAGVAAGGRPARRWLGPLVLAAIACLPRFAFSRVNPVNYDGYWHVFIARNFSREFRGLAHPPLYPLLLHLADAVRHSRFSYLSISLLSGIASVFLFGLVLRKLSADRATPLLGSLALGFSPSAITLSGVAEAYMLCTAFILAAMLFYVDLVVPGPPPPTWSRRAAFAVFTSLALATHYAAGFFLVAVFLAPLLLAAVEPRFRAAMRRAAPSRRGADAVTPLLPVAVATILFLSFARPWAHRLSHVADFYWDPARENVPEFLRQALAGTFHLLAPLRVASASTAAAALVLFVSAAAAVAIVSDQRRDPAVPGATASVLLVLLLALEAVAGLAGRYPFGGAMRHQFLLLLFGLMSALVALDCLLLDRSPAVRRLLVSLGVAAIAANWWAHVERRWQPRLEPFSSEAARFDRDFPSTREVHVDQFNLVGFFATHHDWNWEFLGSVGGEPTLQRYRLTSRGRSLELLAHRAYWNFDPLDPGTYRALCDAKPSTGEDAFTLHGVNQSLPGRAAPSSETLRRQIPELARRAGLEVVRLDVVGGTVFAEFRRAGSADGLH